MSSCAHVRPDSLLFKPETLVPAHQTPLFQNKKLILFFNRIANDAAPIERTRHVQRGHLLFLPPRLGGGRGAGSGIFNNDKITSLLVATWSSVHQHRCLLLRRIATRMITTPGVSKHLHRHYRLGIIMTQLPSFVAQNVKVI